MVDFHSTDRWFVWGIVRVVLNLALMSGWYRLRNALYSTFWPLFSLMDTVAGVLSMILHSKVSNPPLLLATALWSLMGLSALVTAFSRTYIRILQNLAADQLRKLTFLQWTQHLAWFPIPFFIAGTACWVQSDSDDLQKMYYRNVGRVVNWTGGGLLILCFSCSVAAGALVVYWSITNKNVPRPLSIVVSGSLISVPFVLVRLSVQMYWMRFRNTTGADYGLHLGGGIAMNLIIPTINLFFAWYTLSLMKSDKKDSMETLGLPQGQQTSESVIYQGDSEKNDSRIRKGSAPSTFSTVSLSIDGTVPASDIDVHGRSYAAFCNGFKLRTSRRAYQMDSTNALVKATRRVHKEFSTRSDDEVSYKSLSFSLSTVRSDSQRAILQVARLLWLFVLWEECNGNNEDKQHDVEVDIVSIWYEDLGTESERRMSHVHVIRSFEDIKNAVLGVDHARPVEKMLSRVFLHFFEKLERHSSQTRAAACLLAWRLMLKKDLTKNQPYEASFADAAEGDILDIDQETWDKFDRLAAGLYNQSCIPDDVFLL